MKFFIKPTDPSKLDVDLLIAFLWEEESINLPIENQKLDLLIKEAKQKENFTGKDDQILTISTKGYISAYKLLLAGIGKKEDCDLYLIRKAIASSIRKAKEFKSRKIALLLDDLWMKQYSVQTVVQATVEAVSLANYQFLKYKSEEEKQKSIQIEEVIISLTAGKLSAAEESLKVGSIVSEATCFARDLVNEPAAVTTPSYLANVASAISKESKGTIKVRIIEKEEAQKLGMGAYLAVAQGSEEPPKFIHLSYSPPRFKKKITLVGKGITFDTGGLSLKSSELMETMKIDMSGAAVVLAIFKALPEFKIQNQVVGIIAACENMPSGRALKPGDILRSLSGKTIEVLNTDAEGRLTFADALSYAVTRDKPDYLIDIATLTGACMVALGQEIAGLWGNNKDLIEKIQKAAELGGEKVWFMPLEEEYKDLIKSDIADIKNIQTGKYGGAITASLFLSEFVGETPWVHLDIAGPAFAEKETSLVARGGSGFGVRLLLQFLRDA